LKGCFFRCWIGRLHNCEGPPLGFPMADVKVPEKPANKSGQMLKAVDALLAGFGLFGGIAFLGYLQTKTGYALFAPPMMASGIIFFAGGSPPHPQGFLMGTLGSATLAYFAVLLFTKVLPPVAAQGSAAVCLLMWYKAHECVFPPAAVLAGTLTAASVNAGTDKLMAEDVAWFLVFPWLAGHGLLFYLAKAMGWVRAKVRVKLALRQLRSLADNDEVLRSIFNKFDTSGDGKLDATEVKVALRVALGMDMSIEECEKMVSAADQDGGNTLDFEEFKAICTSHL